METCFDFWFGNPSIEITGGNLIVGEMPSEILCMFNIPTSLQVSDVCLFLTPVLTKIKQLRIMKGSASKTYVCCLLTTSIEDSQMILQELSGVPFNALEDHVCEIGFITQLEFSGELFTVDIQACPICLEELHKESISVLCGHSFHIRCLERWGDTTCPVCRYHQSPPDKSHCDTCAEEEGVAMCVICGEMGCGDHARQHYFATGHPFFQDIETRTTWDHSRQMPIHRLVASEGKVVEVPNPHEVSSKKAENLIFEYNCLLSSMLESQKEYYSIKLQEIDETMEESLNKPISDLVAENQKLSQAVQDSQNIDSEIQELQLLIKQRKEKNSELKQTNKQLQQNPPKEYFAVTKEVLEEIQDLENQVDELKLFLKTQRQLAGKDIASIEIRKKKQ